MVKTEKCGESANLPFWKHKTLDEMSAEEWESLCDGCGRCCLNKLEDWDSGEIVWTNVACTLLDGESCRCKDYQNRFDIVPDCLQLTPLLMAELTWLPPTCAYRLLNEGKELFDWHPLVSGTLETIFDAGVSIKGRTIPEDGISPEELENHVAKWPRRVPRSAFSK